MASDPDDRVFHALASPQRRAILDVVKESPGCSVQHVAGYFDTSRINILKHLRVLDEAGLVHSRKQGRTRELYFNPVPIQVIYDRWTTEFSALWASRLTDLKYRVERASKTSWPQRKPQSSRSSSRASRRTSGAR